MPTKVNLSFIDEYYGEYINLLEIPKYRKIKNRKALVRKKRELTYSKMNTLFPYSQEQYEKCLQKRREIEKEKRAFLEELRKKQKIEAMKLKKKEAYRNNIISQMKTAQDIINLEKTHKIVILKFTHSMGVRKEAKPHNNYCEFIYRIDKSEAPLIKAIVLDKPDVEAVINYLKSRKKINK